MSIADSWKAAGTPPPVLMGLRLRPLTLGHVFLLADLDSPFVSDEPEDPTLTDILLAAFCCADGHAAARRGLSSWWLRWFFRFWAWKARRLPADREMETAVEYFRASYNAPRIHRPLKQERTLASPWRYRVLAILMSELHMSRGEALDLEFAEALRIQSALGDLRGTIQLKTQKDEDFWEAAARMDREEMGRN